MEKIHNLIDDIGWINAWVPTKIFPEKRKTMDYCKTGCPLEGLGIKLRKPPKNHTIGEGVRVKYYNGVPFGILDSLKKEKSGKSMAQSVTVFSKEEETGKVRMEGMESKKVKDLFERCNKAAQKNINKEKRFKESIKVEPNITNSKKTDEIPVVPQVKVAGFQR